MSDQLNPQNTGHRPHGGDSGWCKLNDHAHCLYPKCTCTCHKDQP